MMRQIGKQILTIAAALVALTLLTLLALPGAQAAPVVTDPLSGVAIDGYDPVSYFTGAEPTPGRPDFEYVWQGVSWYFASAANRDVFKRNPETYAPQFGGHCAMALSRGYLSDGKPRLYVVEALKLYLFYSPANREAFLVSRSATVAAAEHNWPGLAAGEGAAPQAASVAPEAPAVHVQAN